ncbi:hypothetical protein AB1Y20_006053 [Prymnesium parvum]|uniref:Uncharacterized protein n=1 Tax=Prymnesium parvum TaxID=97485 RepID=A0AB34J426_PRYPA
MASPPSAAPPSPLRRRPLTPARASASSHHRSGPLLLALLLASAPPFAFAAPHQPPTPPPANNTTIPTSPPPRVVSLPLPIRALLPTVAPAPAPSLASPPPPTARAPHSRVQAAPSPTPLASPLPPPACAPDSRCSSDPLGHNGWTVDSSPSLAALAPRHQHRGDSDDDDPFYDLLDYDQPPHTRRRPPSPAVQDQGAPPSRRQRRRSDLERPPADPPFVLPHPLPADHPARWGGSTPPGLHTRGGPALHSLIPPHNDLFRPPPGDPPHPRPSPDGPSPFLNPFVALPTDFVYHIANLFAALYDDPDPRGHHSLPNYSRKPKLIRHATRSVAADHGIPAGPFALACTALFFIEFFWFDEREVFLEHFPIHS